MSDRTEPAALYDTYDVGYSDCWDDWVCALAEAEVTEGHWSPDAIATRLAVAEAKVARVEALAATWERGGTWRALPDATQRLREALDGPS